MESYNIPRLRPLNTGQLLDQAIRLYRRNFFKFIAIIAVVQVPILLLQTVFTSLQTYSMLNTQNTPYDSSSPFGSYSPTLLAGAGGTCIIAVISLLLVQGVATAALTRTIADHYLGQPSGSFWSAYGRIGDTWKNLVVALVAASLFCLLLVAWTVVPCVGWITGLGMLFFTGTAIIPLIAPVVVLEKQSPARAVRRAWDLARRRFWWIIGFVTVLYLFNQLIVTGPTLLITLIFQAVGAGLTDTGNYSTTLIMQTVIQSLTTLILSLLYLPLQLTSITLMYFDLRVRTEGFDLTLLTESALDNQVEAVEIAALTPPPEQKGLITWPEMGNFALISIVGGVLYALIIGIISAVMIAGQGLS